MTTDGSVQLAGTLRADRVVAGEVAIQGNRTVGTGVISTGQTRVVINNSNVRGNSKVFITPRTLTDKSLVVTGIQNGQSFTVEIVGTATRDITFDYWIVGVE